MSVNNIEIAKKNLGKVIYDLAGVLRCMDEAYNKAVDDCIKIIEPLELELLTDEFERLKKK